MGLDREGRVSELIMKEVAGIFKSFRNGKNPGQSGIAAELVKWGE